MDHRWSVPGSLSLLSLMTTWLLPSFPLQAMECASSPRSLLIGHGSRAYLGFEGDDFEHHLNGEEASEDHIEDVHGIVKGSSLLIVLWENQMGTEPKTETPYTQTHIPWTEPGDMETLCLTKPFALFVSCYGHCKVRFWILRVPCIKVRITLGMKHQSTYVSCWLTESVKNIFYFIKICKNWGLVQLSSPSSLLKHFSRQRFSMLS